MPRKSLLACFCALLVASACVPEQDEDRFIRYKRDTAMGRIQDRGEIVVAIDPSMPPFSDIADSFVLEFAQLVADELRVDLSVTEAPTAEILTMAAAGEVDMGFPLEPITERLARRNAFTTPYYVGHQRLLVREDSDIDSVNDLAGKTACTVADPLTGVDITEIVDVRLVRGTVFDPICADQADDADFDAVTGPDPYLISLAAEVDGTRIVGEELTTYGYGAVVPKGASDMQGFVNSVITEAKSEGLWLEYFETHIARYSNATDPTAPDLTLEEAATLYPRELEESG